VLSEPAGASVYLDDEPIGSTDPATGRLVKSGLRPGRHRVRLSRADRADATVEIEVAAGATQTLRSVLSPRAPRTAERAPGLLAFAVLRRRRPWP
jgi:hypothetical protein